jgi:hypothetical protein
MKPQTQTETSINYAALNEPVTKLDVQEYKNYIGKNMFGNWWLLYAIFLAFAGLLFGFVSTGVGMLGGDIGYQVLVWVILVICGCFAVYLGTEHYNKARAKLYKFAHQNNLILILKKQNPSYAGMIFDEGHSCVIDTGFVFPKRAEIGNYQYTTGSGKNQTTHHWAYMKIKLDRKLPHMVLDAKKNNFLGRFSNLSDTFNKEQTLALEGDFNNYFTLYAPRQYERDALYIFTPDVMAQLIDSGSAYDMEVVDDELYIYRSGRIDLGSEAELRQILAIVDAIGSDLREQTDYYSDERVGDRTQNIIASQGVRLKKGINWAVVVIVIFIIFFQAIEWFGDR